MHVRTSALRAGGIGSCPVVAPSKAPAKAALAAVKSARLALGAPAGAAMITRCGGKRARRAVVAVRGAGGAVKCLYRRQLLFAIDGRLRAARRRAGSTISLGECPAERAARGGPAARVQQAQDGQRAVRSGPSRQGGAARRTAAHRCRRRGARCQVCSTRPTTRPTTPSCARHLAAVPL